MMNFTLRELDDLKTKIHSFRVSDLQALVASFGRSRNGKKQDLQNRALEILRTQPQDVDILAFKRKIYELYRVAQDEAKQAHYDFQPQQRAVNPPANTYMAPGPYAVPPLNRPAGNTIIYQNGGIVSGNGYSNATSYSGQMNIPTIQPPPIIATNLGNTVRIINPPISHTNIKFKSLPFYRVRHEILRPTVLKMKPNGRINSSQIFHVSFVLTCDIASDISLNRDYSKNEFTVQAQLRICAIDNSNSLTAENYDFLPLGLYVRMNDKQCALPPCSPCTRPNVEARRIPLPINVTQYLKLSPMNVNKLIINWTPEVGRTFVACVNVVEKLSSNYLLDKLMEKPSISVDVTKGIIARQYKRVIDDDDDGNEDADDDDIATTIVRVSLQCPLAKFRMMYPAKGKNCGHLQCFDGFAYISCNEKKSVWMCPVCSRSLHYDDLLIDQYFVDVLASQESSACQEVQLFVDGTWKVFDEENVTDVNEDKEKSKNSAPSSPGENLSSTCSEEFLIQDNDQKHAVSDNAVSTSGISASVPDSFVDLTEDDDEMDTESETRIATKEGQELPSNTHVENLRSDVPPPNDASKSVEKVVKAINESDQSFSSSTTASKSPAVSPLRHVIQSTSYSTTPPVSPLRLNNSPSPPESISTDEVDSLRNTENVLSGFQTPLDSTPNLSLNPIVLSPSPPRIDRSSTNMTCKSVAEEDNHESSSEDILMDETSTSHRGSPSMRTPLRGPDSVNTVVDLLGKDIPMEEETSVPFESISTLSTPEREHTNDSFTRSASSPEDVRSPVPNEMANLNIGN